MKRRKRGTESNAKLSETTPFPIVEAYKTIRTNLLFSLATGTNKVVVCSSAIQGEGKSPTCANLAIAMAQTEAKVLLLDADLRRPAQHKIFERNNDKGLSSFLGGFAPYEDCLQKEVENNLDLICSGPLPPNPSELLSAERMRCLLERLQKEYDYIFLDTPPINLVSDALILAGKAAGLVLVTRSAWSTYEELTKAVSSIEFSGAAILGLVVVDLKQPAHAYRPYKYQDR